MFAERREEVQIDGAMSIAGTSRNNAKRGGRYPKLLLSRFQTYQSSVSNIPIIGYDFVIEWM